MECFLLLLLLLCVLQCFFFFFFFCFILTVIFLWVFLFLSNVSSSLCLGLVYDCNNFSFFMIRIKYIDGFFFKQIRNDQCFVKVRKPDDKNASIDKSNDVNDGCCTLSNTMNLMPKCWLIFLLMV